MHDQRQWSIPQEDVDYCEKLPKDEKTLIREIVSRASDKWSLWALGELGADGPLRFSRLLERVEGISQKSLTSTLRQLERDGLVTRTVTLQRPIRVDYELTELGYGLIENFHPFWMWATKNSTAFARSRAAYDDALGSVCVRS